MKQQSLAIMIRDQVKKNSERMALFAKKDDHWQGISWTKMGQKIDWVACGLLKLGVQAGDMIGIFAQNSPDFAMIDYGIISTRAATVPIYATNTEQQTAFIINNARISTLFVGGQDQYDRCKNLLGISPYLKTLVVIDETVDLTNTPEGVFSYKDFLKLGQISDSENELSSRIATSRPDEICSLIYTSGTTGEPKGVMLTHANFFCQLRALDQRFTLSEDDIELSFLPLSHVYGKCSGYWVQAHGATVYYCKDPQNIMDYFKEVRPTFMVGVPRLYEKIYGVIYEKLKTAPRLKQNLFHWAIKVGRKRNYRFFDNKSVGFLLELRYKLAQTLVLQKISNLFGGRLRFFSVGGAPLAKKIEEFFLATGNFAAQGYGLTETTAIVTCNAPGKFKLGTTGTVIDHCHIRLDDEGEVLVKGDNVTSGYYRNPKKTAEAFTVDGWFKTGDIAQLDEEGFLKITDRKKDLIVTSGGKNISPQHIESQLGRDPFIEQVYAIGDDRHFISALVVPSFTSLRDYAKTKGIAGQSNIDLIRDPRVIQFYQSRIDRASKDLANFERVKKFTLLPEELSQEGGELTPTMKVKRKIIKQKYKEVIDGMYY